MLSPLFMLKCIAYNNDIIVQLHNITHTQTHTHIGNNNTLYITNIIDCNEMSNNICYKTIFSRLIYNTRLGGCSFSECTILY